MTSDEIVKGSLASYTFENMEIASYQILIAAAETAGQPAIAELCRENLQEEEEMAEWLMEHIPATTAQFMQRDAQDVRARV
jgi:ferritin-like metal-binding protein YciE